MPNFGERLGPYEILEPIGKGGMGEVYRARDTRLGRDVAIKVSAHKFSERFEREARVISALNHPNICTLHDVGANYLVMELIEGQTLRDRLQQGPIPLEDALPIAQQIADALEAAHEKGIIHRDLKPGNIILKPDGSVKVLDFGLAKIGARAASGSGDDAENSPTISMNGTESGVILGTAGYMSPEQAKGQSVDQRSDIYSFGVVLYEMVTGKRLHHGDSVAETLASVIKEEPDWSGIPPQLQKLLRRCLAKDPKKRLKHIGDVMELVDDAPVMPAGVVPGASSSSSPWPIVLASGFVIVGAVLIALFLRTNGDTVTANPVRTMRFEIQPSGGIIFIEGAYPTLSPNGEWMVFPARGPDGVIRQYLRALDAVDPAPLPGTESGDVLPPPVFWSPDSRSIAFSSTSGPYTAGQLMRLDIGGGSPVAVCATPGAVVGGTWNQDNVIVFSAIEGKGLYQVSADGGMAELVTQQERSEGLHRLPQFLPDGRRFLYYLVAPEDAAKKPGVYLGSLDLAPEDQSDEILLTTDTMPRFVPGMDGNPDRLLFLRGDTLFAQPFDTGSLKLTGTAEVVTDRVGTFADYSNISSALFSVSDTGMLAFGGGGDWEVAEYNRQGEVVRTFGDSREPPRPMLSPDGTRVAYNQDPDGISDIWVQDLNQGGAGSTKLTFGDGNSAWPVWSPDGRRIAYGNQRDGLYGIYVKNVDGTGSEELLYSSEVNMHPRGWTPDGRYLVVSVVQDSWDIYLLRLEDKELIPFLVTPFPDWDPAISPDGRWIAYDTNESSTFQVYVRPFVPDDPASISGKWLISNNTGGLPLWRADGKELYYVDLALRQMAVDIQAGESISKGTPRELFTVDDLNPWDVSGDGQRFFHGRYRGGGTAPFTLILNWQAGLAK